MQPRLPAVPAAGGEKTAQLQPCPGTRGLQPACRFAESDRRQLTLDAAMAAGLELLRLVTDQALRDRYAGRGEAQRLALDQDSAELDPVQQRLGVQAAGCSPVAAGSRTSSSDLDFSSFIIGDGALTARLVLIVR